MDMPITPSPMAPQGSSGNKSWVWIVAVVLVLAAVGVFLYYFSQSSILQPGHRDQEDASSGAPTGQAADPDIARLQKQSGSDDVSSIENDLSSTDLDSLDQEVGMIDSQL